jgi:predicted dehydrogenase
MIKVAVIGTGSMGVNHTRVYSELADVQLVGVADTDETRVERVAGKYNTRAYSDYRELLEKEKPEAVSITVPTSLHEQVAVHALQAGAHVLVEKPIAATLEEGQRLIQTAQKVQRQLMVGHIIRFNPAVRALKEKLQAGDLGRIIQIFCRRAGPFPARIRDVGVVVDLAPHDVDIMRFLTGLEPERVFAETEQHIHTEHEDLLFALLRFPQGITGALEINWLTPTKVREVLVLGERGLFRVDDLVQDLYFYENSQANGDLYSPLKNIKGVSEGSMTRFALQRVEPLRAELEAFIHAIQSEKPVPISGEDGLQALRLALALMESGRTHQVVEV